MDLAVDEQGLWVLMSSRMNNKRLNVAKVDVKIGNLMEGTYNLDTCIGMQLSLQEI